MAEDKVVLTADASDYLGTMRRAGDEAEKFGARVSKAGEDAEKFGRKIEPIAQHVSSVSHSMSSGATDATSYFNVLERAGDQADKFGTRITKAGDSVEGLRLKSEARVARNLGEIAQSMTSGASAGEVLAQSITRVSESFRGSLLFAGAAAVGAALYEGIYKAGQAVITLESSIARLNSESKETGFGTSLDQANARLKGINDQYAQILDQNRKWQADPIQKILDQTQVFLATGKSIKLQNEERRNQEKQLRDDAVEALRDIADRTKELNHIDYIRITQGAQAAELKKAELENAQRIREIAVGEAVTGAQDPVARRAEETRYKNEKALINERYAIINSQIDQEGRLQSVQEARSRGFLSAEEAALDSLKLEAAQARDLLHYYQQFHDVDAIRTQDIKTRRAETALADKEFEQLTQAKGDPFFSYRQQLERNRRQGFELERRDYEDRIRRGAYGQTGPEADIFGALPGPGIPDRARKEEEFRGGTPYESQLNKFKETQESFEEQFKPRGLERLREESSYDRYREEQFDKFFHPSRREPEERGDSIDKGDSGIAKNVANIWEFLNKNIAAV